MRRFWFKIAIAGIAALLPTMAMAGDQEIAQQIGQNLKSSGKLRGYSISVKVQDGVAFLNGNVADAKQLDDALSIAEVTPGIERVVNNLSVQTTTASNSGLRQPNGLFNAPTNGIQQVANTTPAPQQYAQQAQTRMQQVPQQYQQQQYQQAPQQYAQQARQMPAPRPVQMSSSPKPITGAHLASRQVPTEMPGQYSGPVEGQITGTPMPAHIPSPNMSPAPMAYDSPSMPNYAWPSYAAHPNYAAVNYPKQYSASAWPYIGPFYPYPQVPLGWRKVSLEWDDGWWMLDFKD